MDDDTVDVSDEYCHDSADDDGRRSWNSVNRGDRRSWRTDAVAARRDADGCPAKDDLSKDRCNVIRKSATAMVLAQCASTGSGLDSRRCRGCSGADEAT